MHKALETLTRKAAAALIPALALLVFASLGARAQTTPPVNYIPPVIQLSNLNDPTQGKVCVLGSSMAADGTAGTVPPYYLASNKQGQGVWKPIGSSMTRVTALDLAAYQGGANTISSILTTPLVPNSTTPPYVYSGTVRFFLVSPGTACSTIFYTFTNTGTGQLNTAYYPYPVSLLELTSYLVVNPTPPNFSVLTIDTSNVDNFQLPMSFYVTTGSYLTGIVGNAVFTRGFTGRAMITGPNGDGRGSPFYQWLQMQPGYQGNASLFAPLVLSSYGWSTNASGSYPYAMIQSPTDYLAYKCLPPQPPLIPNYSPAGCGLSGLMINAAKPLASYYGKELKTFFTTPGLVVMGDAAGTQATGVIPQAAWQLSSNQADCPVYLTPDGKSLEFVMQDHPKKYSTVICNPLGQVVSTAPPLGYTQTPDTVGAVTTAVLQISSAQYTQYSTKMVGWNFGQPESGWTGVIRKFTTTTNPTTKAVTYFMHLAVLGTPVPGMSQKLCLVTPASGTQPACPRINPSFTTWDFSNIALNTSTSVFEMPSQMVFGNDGAFGNWVYPTYSSKLMTVTKSIERNIVAAFSRGIANCNNVTMASAAPPSQCKGVAKLATSAYEAEADGASDAYWANESNWYPANGTQNYYAQYLHSLELTGYSASVSGVVCSNPPSADCVNIFRAPNGKIPTTPPASSLQGAPMGMVYGFAYDETPDYLVAPAAQVSAKLDPISTSWGTGLGVTVAVGRN